MNENDALPLSLARLIRSTRISGRNPPAKLKRLAMACYDQGATDMAKVVQRIQKPDDEWQLP